MQYETKTHKIHTTKSTHKCAYGSGLVGLALTKYCCEFDNLSCTTALTSAFRESLLALCRSNASATDTTNRSQIILYKCQCCAVLYLSQ